MNQYFLIVNFLTKNKTMVPIEKQIEFYAWQLKLLEEEWRAYFTTEVKTLIRSRECFQGVIHGFDDTRGNIILKFPKNFAPRLEMFYSFFWFGDENKLTETYKAFSSCTDSINENNILTVYHLDSDQNSVFTAITNIPVQVFDRLKKEKEEGIMNHVLLGKPEPLFNYIRRLKYFTEINKDSEILKFDFKGSFSVQKFKEDNHADEIIAKLEENDLVIVQGPPGTGKSTLASTIIKKIGDGKKICVTALANKALVEIGKKLSDLDVKNILKTNLTVNERRDIKNVSSYAESNIPPSYVLLTTYYKLTERFEDLKSKTPHFDILVIEEASQAFYTTLAAFGWLAKKVLIIGDPLQLSPIVLNESSAKEVIHLKIFELINGLETLMSMREEPSFFLHETYRLNPQNTLLTNCFYRGILESRNHSELKIESSELFDPYFNSMHPTQLWLREKLIEDADIFQLADELKGLLNNLKAETPIEIAVITSYRNDVRILQDVLGGIKRKEISKLTVETIDRIQGLTVDITIFVLRFGDGIKFVLNKNRFNVATSRCRHYNLLITDRNYELLIGNAAMEVKDYFKRLKESSIKGMS